MYVGAYAPMHTHFPVYFYPGMSSYEITIVKVNIIPDAGCGLGTNIAQFDDAAGNWR